MPDLLAARVARRKRELVVDRARARVAAIAEAARAQDAWVGAVAADAVAVKLEDTDDEHVVAHYVAGQVRAVLATCHNYQPELERAAAHLRAMVRARDRAGRDWLQVEWGISPVTRAQATNPLNVYQFGQKLPKERQTKKVREKHQAAARARRLADEARAMEPTDE